MLLFTPAVYHCIEHVAWTTHLETPDPKEKIVWGQARWCHLHRCSAALQDGPPRPCASEPSKQARPQKDQGSADEYPTKRSAWTAFKWGLLIKRDSLKTITETLVTDTVTFQLNVLYRNFNQLLSDFDVKNKLYSGGVLELISLAFPQSFPHLLRSEMFFRQMQEGKDPRSIHPVS